MTIYKCFKIKLTILYLFFKVLCSNGFAEIQNPRIEELEPNALMKHESKWLVQALEQAHFNKVSIEDLNASKFLTSFIKKLDRQKLYFNKFEIEELKRIYSPTLVTYFKQGNLFPGFEIYNSYKKKAIVRLDWAIKRLGKDINFDQNISYNYNREKLNWADTKSNMDNVWENLIKHELLNELLSRVDENVTTADESLIQIENDMNNSKDVLVKRYQRWKKSIIEFESQDLQELYLTALTQMFDPHTTFMNLKEKERFDQTMNNEFVGIGAVLTQDDGYCTIKELLPGGPAEASRQLEPDDIILKVAQADNEFIGVVDMKLSKIVELIKGPKDTIVRLEIRPIKDPATTKTVRIVRDKIKLTENLASASIHKASVNDFETNLGVIELPSFYGSSGNGPKATDDVEELINELKKEKIEGLILDLRRNGGGYLSEAVNLAGLFISRGPIVQVKSTDGKIRKKFDFNPKLAWDGPLIVLVSRYSASASEIVAGALKNHKRALIVGDSSTHGKGTVQSLIQMNLPFNFSQSTKKGSAAKVTIQKYYLPSGDSTQITGVKSDVSMRSINDYLPIGESDLENALEWDSIPPVNFRRPVHEFVYEDSDLEKLKELSSNRQSDSEEFKYIDENVDWVREKREKKLISLRLKDRVETKIADEERSQNLVDVFEQLSQLSFPFRSLKLEVVEEQLQKSLLIQGKSSDVDASSSFSSFEKPEDLDIRLHETLRIMSDWIVLLENSPITINEPEKKSEI